MHDRRQERQQMGLEGKRALITGGTAGIGASEIADKADPDEGTDRWLT
jgi:hypothetical protein